MKHLTRARANDLEAIRLMEQAQLSGKVDPNRAARRRLVSIAKKRERMLAKRHQVKAPEEAPHAG